jgi:hypothetical protein
MFDPGVSRLMHRHGDEWFEMTPRAENDASPEATDIERSLVRGEQVMQCSGCDTQIRVARPDAQG